LDYSNITTHNLPPQSTVFVGRQSEISNIVSRFQDQNCCLLTLVGSGGIGKTRLAIESTHAFDKMDFEHGVFYVPLAPLTSADSIVTTIINVLGININEDGTPKDELVKFLSQRNLLLVMDNFEHVLDGVDIVADILNNSDRVKILVTSREVLNLSIEHVWHVRGMRYPNSEEPEDINQYDALNLFIERAIQVRRDFSPSAEQISIIHICQQVGGLPLAIELAAGWLKILSCTDILKQIEQGINFLATRNRDVPERHRSIRAVINHSWDLLSDEEQAIFPRLSVFRDGFTLEAAEHVASADLMTLSSLVEKSMVRRDTNGRYDLHELMRQYAEEHLINKGNLDSINQSHLDYFANFMIQRVPDLQGRRQVEALDETRADFDNIRIAFEYASRHSNYAKLERMLECLSIYFDMNAYPPLVNEMYTFAITHLDNSPEWEHDRLRNRLRVFSYYAYLRQSNERIAEELQEDIQPCLKIAEHYDDKLAIWMCLVIIMYKPHNPQFDSDMKRALKISESIHLYYLACTLAHKCHYYVTVVNQQSETIQQTLEQYLEITQTLDDIKGMATAYFSLGHYARFWGTIDDAIYYFNQGIQRVQQINDTRNIAFMEAHVVLMRLRQGEFAYFIQHTPYLAEQMARFGYYTNHPYMYTMMAKAEALLGNYAQSKTNLQKIYSYSIFRFIRLEFHIIEAKIMYAIGLNDFQSVRRLIAEALQIDTSVISTRLKLDFLTLVAFLYHHDQQSVKATELLGLIFSHPLAARGWMEKWELLSQLREILQQKLGEDSYLRDWEYGQQLDVEETIDEVHAYVGLEIPSYPVRHLIDPLTERELEVLTLLGEGRSNRNIAQELTVTVGTVKSHVHNICQKLSAKNRTQAVLEAKQLGLL
jgi:predicted ATPase/DNA-binding CsgD family transcriptional regulator